MTTNSKPGVSPRRGFWIVAATSTALLSIIAGPGTSHAQSAVQRIAAVVNNDIISNRDVNSRIGLAVLVSGLPDDPTTRQRLVAQILRGLIDERLELQEAARLKVTVSENEIDHAFDDIAQRNKMSGPQLSQFLASRNVDPAIVRDQLRAQVAWLKIISRSLRSRVVVTREQVDLALKSKRAADEELLVSQIVLPVYETNKEQEVIAQANDLVTSIRRGADFAALARQLSAAQDAETGGDLGWIRLSAVAPDLRGPLERLQPGQLSDPIKSQAGVHIFEVRDRRRLDATNITATEADRDQVRQQLQDEQLQRLAARYLRDLRRSAFIDVRL